jgi:AcrR family transcriptional regulator
VSGRREALLDAAIAVLGRHGMRGLTHRAVNAEAGVPPGTVSNYFPTREALLGGVVDRVVERERAAFEALAVLAPPTSPHELATVLAGFVAAATGPNRDLALSRFALLVEAANRPALAERMAGGARAVDAWSARWMTGAGLSDPARDVPLLARQVDALTLHQLAHPDPGFDPERALLGLIEVLTAARPQRK